MKWLLIAGLVLIVVAGGLRLVLGRGARPQPASPAAAGPAPAPAAPQLMLELSAAKQQVEATVAGQPKNYEIRIQAATFYMRAGEYAAALPHLRAATRLGPKQALPWLAMGDAQTFLSHYDEAKSAYDRAAELSPGNPMVIRGRGQLLVVQQRFDAARDVLEAGLKQHPEDADIRLALGNLYLIRSKPRRAIEVLEPALSRAPNSVDVRFVLAQAYERDLHLEKAIKELQEVTRLAPQMDEAWGRMGLYLVNLTRYTEARPPLERAIVLNPRQSHYYSALADSYVADGSDPANFDRAVQQYRKALELDPRNDKALYSLAMARTRRGRSEDLREAVALLKRLIALNPHDMNGEFKLAETYRRLGQTSEAQAHTARFRKLFELGRRQTREKYHAASFTDTADAHLKLARRYLAERSYRLAETEFQLALDRDPTLEEARRGLEQVRGQRSSGAGEKSP